MIVAHDERFRRLLRWYPRAWRDQNGDILLGTMLDDAERTGRSSPSVLTRLSAFSHGVGTRFNTRLALSMGLSALVVAGVCGGITNWAIHPLAMHGAAWVLPFLTIALGPSFVAVCAVALARQRGLVSEPRTVTLVLLTLIALLLAALAQVSWGLGIDAADRGILPTGLASFWAWLFVAAWAFGASAIAVFVDAVLRRSQKHHSARTALVVIVGVLAAPVIGLSLVSPYTLAIASSGVALLASLSTSWSLPRRPSGPVAHSFGRRRVPIRTRSLARLLAVVTAVASTCGVLYALAGSRWGDTGDATTVMGQGITIALLSTLPLIAGVGAIAVARSRILALHTWGPLALIALALGALAIAYLEAPVWEAMVTGFTFASILGGLAIFWWLAPRLPRNSKTRPKVAAAMGFVFAAFVGMIAAPMLAFFVPLLAVAFAIWGARRPRTDSAGSALSLPAGVFKGAI